MLRKDLWSQPYKLQTLQEILGSDFETHMLFKKMTKLATDDEDVTFH
jgi:hypothetical protein